MKRATVLVGVITNRNSHASIARHNLFVKRMMAASNGMQQEGGHSISVMYFTNAELESGNFMSVGEHGDPNSNRRTATLRAFLSIWFTARNCLALPNLQWFMTLDDDAVFHPARLNKFLYVVGKQLGSPTRTPIVIGRDAAWTNHEVFGGNGILFSKASLDTLNGAHVFRDVVKDWAEGRMPYLENMVKEVTENAAVRTLFTLLSDVTILDQ